MSAHAGQAENPGGVMEDFTTEMVDLLKVVPAGEVEW